MTETIRPTKKQQELLRYIELFIAERGYSPSYREIMAGLGYNSIATVALHIKSLISRGHLQKRDKSARSLEVVNGDQAPKFATNQVKESEEKWLIEKIDYFFRQVESAAQTDSAKVDELYILVGALRVLGLATATQSFSPRLLNLKQRLGR